MLRSASGSGASVSVAELLAGLVSPDAVTVAVLDRGPVADDAILAVTVYVTVSPTGISTVSLMFPETGPAVQLAPPVATQVQVAFTGAGNVSATVAFVASA